MRNIQPLVLILLLSLTSCDDTDKKQVVEYKGPLRELENVEYLYSEQEKVTVKLIADLVYEFQNGDREFPHGLDLSFYDEFGKVKSTLRADRANFVKADNLWRGQGDVEVKNIAKQEQLNTEELFWNPKDKKIYTDKFVTIRQQSDVIYGEGLDAAQDLSTYKIRNLNNSELHVDE